LLRNGNANIEEILIWKIIIILIVRGWARWIRSV